MQLEIREKNKRDIENCIKMDIENKTMSHMHDVV